MKRSKIAGLLMALAGITGVGAGDSQGAVYTWSPTVTGATTWASGVNWSAVPVGATDARLSFVGNNGTAFNVVGNFTPSNDIAGDFRLYQLDLQGTAHGTSGSNVTITILGSPLLFGTNGLSGAAVNLNALRPASGLIYYNAGTPIKLAADLVLQGDGNAMEFRFSGSLTDASGTNGVTKKGLSSVIFSAVNAYGGPTVMEAGSLTLVTNNNTTGSTMLKGGQLTVNHAGALGSGPVTILGGQLDNSTGAAITWSANNPQSWEGNFSFRGTRDLNTGTGAVTMTASRSITVNANVFTVGGMIGGPGLNLYKYGAGTLALASSNTYSGTTTVRAGTLKLDFNQVASPAADILVGTTSVALAGGTLSLGGKNATNAVNSQTLGGLILLPGAASLAIVNGITNGQTRLDLGPISRSAGATVNVVQPTVNTAIGPGNGFATSATNDASGILGGWATVATTNWACQNGANIVAYTGCVNLTGTPPSIDEAPVANLRLSNASTGAVGQAAATVTINSLLMNDPAVRTVSLTNGCTIRLGAAGGVLTATGAAPSRWATCPAPAS
jgi:autotransporter-associated beta strand protein